MRLPEPVEDVVVNLLRLANTKLPMDIGWALEAASGLAAGEIASIQLGAIMANAKKAEHLGCSMSEGSSIPR